MVSLFFKNRQETFIGSCFINKILASYLICTLQNQTMYVLRISIDDNYYSYRPGILLIVESVNELLKSKYPVRYLDFSRGNESYKINYGGTIHHNYCITLL